MQHQGVLAPSSMHLLRGSPPPLAKPFAALLHARQPAPPASLMCCALLPCKSPPTTAPGAAGRAARRSATLSGRARTRLGGKRPELVRATAFTQSMPAVAQAVWLRRPGRSQRVRVVAAAMVACAGASPTGSPNAVGASWQRLSPRARPAPRRALFRVRARVCPCEAARKPANQTQPCSLHARRGAAAPHYI